MKYQDPCIAIVRAKVLTLLQSAANYMKETPFGDGAVTDEVGWMLSSVTREWSHILQCHGQPEDHEKFSKQLPKALEGYRSE